MLLARLSSLTGCTAHRQQFRGQKNTKGSTNDEASSTQISFDIPLGPIEDSRLHDKDAEDVIQHAEAEQRAQEEQDAMASQDPLLLVLEQSKKEPSGERLTVSFR